MLFSVFGAEKITLEMLKEIDATAPPIIVWAVPLMLFFTALEYYFNWRENSDRYDNKELLGSIGVGVGNLIVSAAIKIGLFIIVVWFYNLVPWRMKFSWWMLIPCYIFLDLCSYWAHRISHEQRIWWATHVTHHSGNHYNLSVSFRLSWIQHFKVLFFLPVSLAGFHPLVFFICNQIAVLFQFWVHTEYIHKLPKIFELIIATPSNHRVHHGTQEKYLDKNYAPTFIFWDKIFGTYQPEEERPIYGLTMPIHSANPFYIVFHELMEIFKDLKKAKTLKQTLWIIFGHPNDIYKWKKEEEFKKQKAKIEKVVA